MHQKKRDYGQAIDLEYLNFEELGRSPVPGPVSARLDSVPEKLPLPHFSTLKQRAGNPEQREFFQNQFGPDITGL